MTRPRIYLDNAATSWPKPEAVYRAVDHYLREVGGPNGRSGYREALEANRIVERARRGVAELVGARDLSRIVFGFNGTDVLNLAIRGIVRSGDHVVTTVCEHNSVLRPLRALRETADVNVTYVPCDGQGFVSPDDVRAAIRPSTRLVAVVHASNVTGALQPIAEIGKVVRGSSAYFLVDAAQSLGHVPIDVGQLEVDLLAAPGHKGLLGPLGTGVLYVRPGAERDLQPLRCGGTGTQSEEDRQPDGLPDKYEPGNHNLPGLAGLAAATDFLRTETIEAIHARHTPLTARLLEGLSDVPGVTIHGPQSTANRSSVVSITALGYDPQELAAMLDASQRIQCRAGLHCAPRMHEALGTTAGGGTLRLSPGYFTSLEEIDTVIATLAEVSAISPQRI
ncbi:MAG TPA: aminotransferase class V-fold PLP-dependent enzyme [Lacipirellulaceae bacterium]